jgi:hypothetical protein
MLLTTLFLTSILKIIQTINDVEEEANVLKNQVAEYLLVIARVVSTDQNEPATTLSNDLLRELVDLKR